MKLVNLVGDRFKERPSDCVIDSHALMIKGGYMKHVANGIYSENPPLKRMTRKIENIIREEMDKIEGQEVKFPVALPGSLWEESGRFESVGSELLRFKDRNGSQMLLGMTHEEAAVQLVREYGQSYTKYPFMIYQLQTKFRDEARPRAGLIRVREFTMKDAYSFHTSQEDLETYYNRCLDSYNTIFKRAGIEEVITVKSDSGMMGGSVAHEFMLLTPVGEDSLAICDSCDYSANLEAAENITVNESGIGLEVLTLVETPNKKTINDVVNFLDSKIEASCKAVVYQRVVNDSYIIVFTRGDMDVSDTKLMNAIGQDVYPAIITEESGIIAGFIGPYEQKAKATLVFDSSLKGIDSLIIGANKVNYHYTGFNMERDFKKVKYLDVSKIKAGGICPKCGNKTIKISRGIEVGNIFQLGAKYTKAMKMTYIDANGKTQNPVMGCYGIGIGRLAASVCEVRHDDYGPIWPISIAPWEVHLCCLRADNVEAKTFADNLYATMQNEDIEVLYDDREVRPGVMFSDADLLGIPVRVIVSPRNLKESVVEVMTRTKSVQKKVAKEDIIAEVKALVNELKAELLN